MTETSILLYPAHRVSLEHVIIGLNFVRIHYRKNDESQESVFKDATGVCLPLINATIRDLLEKEGIP